MLAKDEGQDICTTLGCYEAAMESLRACDLGEGAGSVESITAKALNMLGNNGDCDLSVRGRGRRWYNVPHSYPR